MSLVIKLIDDNKDLNQHEIIWPYKQKNKCFITGVYICKNKVITPTYITIKYDDSVEKSKQLSYSFNTNVDNTQITNNPNNQIYIQNNNGETVIDVTMKSPHYKFYHYDFDFPNKTNKKQWLVWDKMLMT